MGRMANRCYRACLGIPCMANQAYQNNTHKPPVQRSVGNKSTAEQYPTTRMVQQHPLGLPLAQFERSCVATCEGLSCPSFNVQIGEASLHNFDLTKEGMQRATRYYRPFDFPVKIIRRVRASRWFDCSHIWLRNLVTFSLCPALTCDQLSY